MESLGYEAIPSDLYLFRHKETGILVILYVDNLLISTRTVNIINTARDRLKAHFELKELGNVKRFLGFDIVRDHRARKIFIS